MLARLEARITEETRRRLRVERQLADEQDARARMERRVDELAAATETLSEQERAAADNLLRNTECEFSHDVYDNDPPAGGDEEELCAWWFSHADSDTLLLFTDAERIKSDAHSGYVAGTDDPDWDKANGRLRLGTKRTISQPLVNLYAQRGNVLYLQFTATLRTATALPSPLHLYAGIWDNTAGEEKWVEGAPLAVEAVVVGAAGAVTVEYMVIIDTDTGEQYEAVMAAPLATAPASLTALNYVTVSWPAVPARTLVTVYKEVGGLFYRMAEVTSGATDWNDTGAAGTAVGGFPSAALNALRARIQDDNFAPSDEEVRRYAYAIPVPDDYDISVTDEQVLRIGLSDDLADDYQLILDRFSLGFNYGGFQRSPHDLNVGGRVSVTDGVLAPPPGGTDDAPERGRGGVRAGELLEA